MSKSLIHRNCANIPGAFVAKPAIICVLGFTLMFASSSSTMAADIKILYSFTDSTDGVGPAYDGFVISGSTMYGATCGGGPASMGNLFSMQLDGSGFHNIYAFSGTDGASPYAVTLDGSTLIGTTLAGGGDFGADGDGTIYAVQTNGTNFREFHTFSGTDGSTPYYGVAVSGSRLYGVTPVGGSSDEGVVYSLSENGIGYQVLYSFSGGSDGLQPYGAPTVSGSTLYGMSGTSLYKMNTDGTGFQVLAGVGGLGELTLSGSTLYGIASRELNAAGQWTFNNDVFRIGVDGSGFQVLATLDGQSQSGLALVGSTLYGVTRWGGSANEGEIFSLNTNGTDFQVLHSFVGGPNDGDQPLCTPVVIGSTLYGTTWRGGAGSSGLIYSLPLDTPGDANGDGKVDINDLTVVLTNFGQTGMTWSQGDFIGNGTVDINDLTIVLTNYNQTAGSSAAGNVSAVPEPSALALSAVALLGFAAVVRLGRRRRC